MRFRRAGVVLTIFLVLVATGCSRQLAGTAVLGPDQPGVAITRDTVGIHVGLADAPVQLEIYTEPQCSHCADLQADFGDQLAYYIGIGDLAVTYRPMTFLDRVQDGYSAHVATAMFAAAGSGAGDAVNETPARAFQRFVQDLWAHQDTGGQGPSNAQMATMAQESGIPASQVGAIASGSGDVNTKDMEETNFGFLYEIDPTNTGTPTVYDLIKGEKLDIYDNDWLSTLMES